MPICPTGKFVDTGCRRFPPTHAKREKRAVRLEVVAWFKFKQQLLTYGVALNATHCGSMSRNVQARSGEPNKKQITKGGLLFVSLSPVALNPFAPGVFSLRIRQDYRSYCIFLFFCLDFIGFLMRQPLVFISAFFFFLVKRRFFVLKILIQITGNHTVIELAHLVGLLAVETLKTLV